MSDEDDLAVAIARAVAAKNRGQEIADANRAAFTASTGAPPAAPDTARANAIAERDIARSGISRGEAAVHGFNQGTTYGFFDEALGVVSPEAQARARQRLEQARTAYPGITGTAQVTGAIASPVNRAIPATTSIRGAVGVGAGTGALAAAGEGEGGVAERGADALSGAATGMFFGGLSASLFKGASNGMRRLFQRAEERPTIEALRGVKNAAYAAVRRSGVEFDENDTLAMFQRLGRKAKTSRWDLDPVSEVDKAALDALRVLERRATLGRPISLNNLDKTRQKLWDMYSRSDHPFILEAIGEIDGAIAAKAAGNELMQTARAANSQYSKAQLLETAFKKARLQTAATGSGGNILNKYRQAVASIINKPHEAKWFSEEELALMERFVMGDDVENVLRRAGKLAPGGNGLMTALNVYAASVDPSLLAITGAATAAKAAADRGAMRGSEELLDAVATGVIRQPQQQPRLNVPAVGGAIAGQEILR